MPFHLFRKAETSPWELAEFLLTGAVFWRFLFDNKARFTTSEVTLTCLLSGYLDVFTHLALPVFLPLPSRPVSKLNPRVVFKSRMITVAPPSSQHPSLRDSFFPFPLRATLHSLCCHFLPPGINLCPFLPTRGGTVLLGANRSRPEPLAP